MRVSSCPPRRLSIGAEGALRPEGRSCGCPQRGERRAQGDDLHPLGGRGRRLVRERRCTTRKRHPHSTVPCGSGALHARLPIAQFHPGDMSVSSTWCLRNCPKEPGESQCLGKIPSRSMSTLRSTGPRSSTHVQLHLRELARKSSRLVSHDHRAAPEATTRLASGSPTPVLPPFRYLSTRGAAGGTTQSKRQSESRCIPLRARLVKQRH